MILEFPAQNASLASFLHARALTSSSRRLMLDVVIGLVVASVAVWLHGKGWILFASIGCCFAAYGAWAFAERRLEMDDRALSRLEDRLWTLLRASAALFGFCAALVFTFSLAAATLGTWIS